VEGSESRGVSDRLPDTYQQALLLEAAGIDGPEIALRLGVEPSASTTLLLLARAKLLRACRSGDPAVHSKESADHTTSLDRHKSEGVLGRGAKQEIPTEVLAWLVSQVMWERWLEELRSSPANSNTDLPAQPCAPETSKRQFMTGSRPLAPAERILATVLFSDIVGSTEQAASLGDRRWHALLDAHDQAVREELGRYRGREIKTTGDGFMASFDRPARAIHCAKAIAEATSKLGLAVRMGLHTGECEVRGDDLGGLAVHIAARVAAKAGPCEVLVSGTVKDLVVGSGIEFTDRGEHQLKSVPGSWRLFAAES
jgi:class 3 adenylate cyclase